MHTFVSLVAIATSLAQVIATPTPWAAVLLSAAVDSVAAPSAAVAPSAAIDPASQPSAAVLPAGAPSIAVSRRADEGDIFCDPESAFTAFYRAYNGPTVDHFYTTSVTELDNAVNQLGYSAEGITRRVLTAESACPYIKSEPLYRAYSTTAFDHFYTTSESEWNNAIVNLGYNREGIAGYVYADQVCDSIPLFRTYGAAGTDYFYTANEQEYDGVVEGGFADEGIVGYILPA